MGLSVMGIFGVGGGGTVAVGVVLVAAAWALGWFSPGGGLVPPIIVDDEVPADFETAPRLDGGDKRGKARKSVESAVRQRAPGIGKTCDAAGTLEVDLLLDRDGDVRYAQIRGPRLASKASRCVKGELEDLSVSGSICRARWWPAYEPTWTDALRAGEACVTAR